MSYITKEKNTMYKDDRNKITINKDLFAFASDFSDEYFANDLNWKKIAIHFKHSSSNQTKIIVLMQEANEGWFEVTETARTGVWQVTKIQVFDKDGGMDTIERSGIPTPTNFDIETQRKVAPSELVTAFAGADFTVGDAQSYEVGFKIKLWDEGTLNFLSATVYEIVNKVGNTLTLNEVPAGTAGKTLRLKFPNYADASPRQKGMFQFVGVTF